MKNEEKLYLASKAAEKGWSYETLKYGDDLYNYSGYERDEIIDDIWDYVETYKAIGSVEFRERFKEFKLY